MAEEEKSPYVPWGLHPLEPHVVEELLRRTKEYGMNPLEAGQPGNYSGPKSAWIRVCSNGKGVDETGTERDGFVLGGVHGFDDSYGFNTDKKIVIGEDAMGNKHQISFDTTKARTPPNTYEQVSDLPHRPPPNLTSIECELSGAANSSFPSLCRKVKINFVCNSLAQLNYLIPYFFTPRITVLVEWGWNHYNPASLVDLKDITAIADMFTNPENIYNRIRLSGGNYDAAIGFITDFGYTLNAQGGYDCFTSITNANFLLEGQAHQNQTAEGQENGQSIQKKTLKEFIQVDLENIDSAKSKEVLSALGIKISGRIFSASPYEGNGQANTDKKKWINMGLLTDILNTFCSAQMVDFNGNPVTATKISSEGIDPTSKEPIRLNRFDIEWTQMSAHPALKSVNPDILFPNKFAPRFVIREEPTPNDKNILGKKVNGTPYATLFPNVATTIQKYGFDRAYDDLYKLINSKNEILPDSFPSYDDWDDPKMGKLNAGYYGWLLDVYVSTTLLKNLLENNDTVLKFLEALLQYISEAMCNIAQLKLVVPEYSNTIYSVMDANLSYINNAKEAERLSKITIGSTDSAFMRSAQFDVKLSAEMANQMVFQSANPNQEIPPPPGYATVSNDPKKSDGASRFSKGDRLFDKGFLPKSVKSDLSPEQRQALVQQRAKELEERDEARDKAKMKRMLSDDNKVFYTYERGSGQNKTTYILAETESDFIRYLVTALDDPKAAYLNNAIMPGTTFSMEILGLSGITYLSQFTLDHVPDTYNSQNAVWQISDVKHVVDSKVWTTSITAQVRPLSFISTKT